LPGAAAVATVAVTSGMAVGGCQAKAVAGAARFGSATEARRWDWAPGEISRRRLPGVSPQLREII
jgi:hypothetical protein